MTTRRQALAGYDMSEKDSKVLRSRVVFPGVFFPNPIQIRTTNQPPAVDCLLWKPKYFAEALEALATAHVLRRWMFPHLLQKRVDGPFVMSPNDRVMELTSEATKFLIVVCTKDGGHRSGVLPCFNV